MQQSLRFPRQPQHNRPRRSRLARIILFTLLIASLAACGAPANVAPTSTVAPQASSGGIKIAQLKIALIAPNRISDKGYLELAWKGVQDAEKELGATIKALEILDKDLVAHNIDDLVNQGYNVIIFAAQTLTDVAAEAAKKYPQIVFIGVDQDQQQAPPNLVGLVFREDQAGYLAGALAALMSKTNQVGAVLGPDVIPQIWLFGEGFRQGALAQKPDIKVTLAYHNDVTIDQAFIDPQWGALQANEMMAKDDDVILTAAGGTGTGALLALTEHKDQGVMGIGVDADQYFTVPDAQPILLSSAKKEVDKGILDILKQVQAGTVKGGNFLGTIGLAPFHDLDAKVTPAVKQTIGDLQQQIASGQIKIEVPARPAK
jgi:basic membrane protein A